MPASSGNAQSSSSIITPFERGLRLVDRQLEQLQDHRLVAARAFRPRRCESRSASADLAGGAGDGNSYGVFHGEFLESGGRECHGGRLREQAGVCYRNRAVFAVHRSLRPRCAVGQRSWAMHSTARAL